MTDRLTDRDLQSLRNMGGLAEQAADEIAADRAQVPAEEAWQLIGASSPEEYAEFRCWAANGKPPIKPQPQRAGFDEAVAAGDGTLHGAINYWQERALAAEAKVPSEAEMDAHETNQVLANNYLELTCGPAPSPAPDAEWLPLDVAMRLAHEYPGAVTVGLVQSIAKAVGQLKAAQAQAAPAALGVSLPTPPAGHGYVLVRIDTTPRDDGWCFCTPMNHPDDVKNGRADGPYDDGSQLFGQVLVGASALAPVDGVLGFTIVSDPSMPSGEASIRGAGGTEVARIVGIDDASS